MSTPKEGSKFTQILKPDESANVGPDVSAYMNATNKRLDFIIKKLDTLDTIVKKIDTFDLRVTGMENRITDVEKNAKFFEESVGFTSRKIDEFGETFVKA